MSAPRTDGTVRSFFQQDRTGLPWYARVFMNGGRPVLSVVVLVLCAPGERQLAEMAGWWPWLSWGYAGLLASYTAISAIVATVRPKDADGHTSAVVGAVLALLLAMAAQPIAHLFVTGWLSAYPRPPIWLVVVVSSTPPLILGHLYHLSVNHEDKQTGKDTVAVDSGQSGTSDIAAQDTVRTGTPRTDTFTEDRRRDTVAVDSGQSDTSDNVRQISRTTSGVSALVRELVSAGHDDADIRDKVSEQLPDTRPDSLRRIIHRARKVS